MAHAASEDEETGVSDHARKSMAIRGVADPPDGEAGVRTVAAVVSQETRRGDSEPIGHDAFSPLAGRGTHRAVSQSTRSEPSADSIPQPSASQERARGV